MKSLESLYKIILSRKESFEEGSYTSYLFKEGLDKILKKVAEESGETIIAAKNQCKEDIVNESCDLIFHLLVLLANENISLDDIEKELEERSKKIGNLKKKTISNPNS